jgi:DNA-dependent RNA polymerase auxiliary subunit epsilon
VKDYIVGVTIHNAIYVKAETPEEARQQVRDMGTAELLSDSDFNITYTDEQEDYSA